VIRDEDLTDRPHGCTVQNDGLIRLYMSGTQSCTDPASGLDYCLCKTTYVKVDGESCNAEGYADIYDLDECVAARDELGFPEHDSVILDEFLTDRPHGCMVQHDGLVRLYLSGTQACTDAPSSYPYCLCKRECPAGKYGTEMPDCTDWTDPTAADCDDGSFWTAGTASTDSTCVAPASGCQTVGEPNEWCIPNEDGLGMVCNNDGQADEMHCFNDDAGDFICGTPACTGDSAPTGCPPQQVYAGQLVNMLNPEDLNQAVEYLSLDQSQNHNLGGFRDLSADGATNRFYTRGEASEPGRGQEFSFPKFLPGGTSGGLGAPLSDWAADGASEPLLSGDTVAWYHPGFDRAYDCSQNGGDGGSGGFGLDAGSQCSLQAFPFPGGHWGSPYRIYLLDGSTGDRIHSGDSVYFDRMVNGDFNADATLQATSAACQTSTSDATPCAATPGAYTSGNGESCEFDEENGWAATGCKFYGGLFTGRASMSSRTVFVISSTTIVACEGTCTAEDFSVYVSPLLPPASSASGVCQPRARREAHGLCNARAWRCGPADEYQRSAGRRQGRDHRSVIGRVLAMLGGSGERRDGVLSGC
jgi:hypothetical protein